MIKLTEVEREDALYELRNRLTKAIEQTPRGISDEEICEQTLRVYTEMQVIWREASCLTKDVQPKQS